MGEGRVGMKPRLALQVCCAPDEAWAVQSLRDTCQLHCFFCNPNIYPPEEFDKRRDEAASVARHYGVEFTADPYLPDQWEKAIAGHEHTPEGGERCYHCFLLRFRRTARFCRESGILRFATVMSISPHKRIEMLDRAGHAAAEEYGVEYVPFNLKKKDGFKKSIELSRELGLYRQDYCGCRLSLRERDRRAGKPVSGPE